MKKATFCFLIIVAALIANFMFGAIPASERAALIALYNSTNGDGWTDNSGWKTPPLDTDGFAIPGTEGNWCGITLSGNSVSSIVLCNKKLSGSLPSQLGNLSNLNYLNLSLNQLTGSIPPAFGNLNNLVILALEYNQLSGSLPSELGNLSKLIELSLDHNQLSGSIPPELGNLNSLRLLYLFDNRLSGSIPSELGNPSDLEYVNLSANQLTGSIPFQFGNLSNLKYLNLFFNTLTGGIPPEIGNLNKLYYLNFSTNILSGSIPPELGNLSNLESLFLKQNQLSGEIPLSFLNFTKITDLDVGLNCLSATDPALISWLNSHDPDWNDYQDECGTRTTPTVITDSVSFITVNSAVCGGNVTSCGGYVVTARGVCWSNVTNPTINDSKTADEVDGIGSGPFTSYIYGLSANTTYYVRAYATNLVGTSYGENKSFKTGSVVGIPIVTTASVSSITAASAICGGNVVSDGGATVTARGVCWNTDSNPTIANSKTDNGTGTGSFTSNISGLRANTTYYVRAYATNSIGTSYGLSKKFKTSSIAGIPTVTTNSVSSITPNSAVCGGNVISDGGAAVTARGVCWNSASNPTISNEKSSGGTGLGSFTSSITGLTAGTTYYVRAFAINSSGTSYGANMSFTTLPPGPPVISLNHTSLNFGAVTPGAFTRAQTVLVSNTGSGTLNWSASGNAAWLAVTPASGTGDSVFSVTVDPAGLAVGNYTGAIIITDPNASNSPQAITASLHVYDQGETTAPFGEFSTPLDGASTYNSVPVTGWALDDIGVANVKIYNGDAYIGDALLVEGARPDVEAAFPTYPNNYKAGWGYMLLTHFLPDGGNGTYTLMAKATDLEGNEVTLGSKTITIDNAHSVKPFGAIDTPSQGGTASGRNFVNYGWALTPQSNSIPVDGTTINVYVDGVVKGHPLYNVFRTDIAALFPGYANTDGAVGYYYLDTAKLSNGVHTIAWTVTDSAGNSDGIGSRYFTVQNLVSSDQALEDKGQGTGEKGRAEINESRRGEPPCSPDFDQCSSTSTFDETTTVEIKELERVEINLSDEEVCEGYLVVGDQLRGLPIGSTLNKDRGVFYWQPGPGFVGEYRLVFIGMDNRGQYTMKNIVVHIKPMYSGIDKQDHDIEK